MTTIAAFQLSSGLTQAAGPFKIGHAFRAGDVPAGSYVATDLPNSVVLPLRRWNDGSLKHAMIIGRVDLVAGTPRQVNLIIATAAPRAGAALTAADIEKVLRSAPETSVACGHFGSVTLASLLKAPVRTFVSTKEMVECHYTSKIGHDVQLYCNFHVRLFRDGRAWVRIIVGNAYLDQRTINPTQKEYVPALRINGVTVFDNNGAPYHHAPYAKWDQEGWIGADPQIVPRHDTGYLARTKLVPNTWKLCSPKRPADFAKYATYTPGSNLDFSAAMGTTGYQDDIGLLPLWEAVYLTSQANPTMYRTVLAHARATNSYAIGYTESRDRQPAQIAHYPKWSIYGPDQAYGGPPATVKQDNKTALTWEMAHFPSIGYLAYLLTADYYFFETCALCALTVYLSLGQTNGEYFNRSRNGGLGIDRVIHGQTRAIGWGYRSIAQCAAIYPEQVADRYAEYSAWFRNICQQETKYYTGTPYDFIGYTDFYSSRSDGYALNGKPAAGTAPWEHHFVAQAMGMAKDIQPTDAGGEAAVAAFADYCLGCAVWIMGGTGPKEFNFGYASNYDAVRIRTDVPITSGGVSHKSFRATDPGMIFSDSYSTASKTVGNDATNNALLGTSGGYPGGSTGFWANLLPALAYAVDHRKAGADAAFARFLGATNFAQQDVEANYGDTPTFGIVPRSYAQPPIVFAPQRNAAVPPLPAAEPAPAFASASLPASAPASDDIPSNFAGGLIAGSSGLLTALGFKRMK